MYRKWAARDTVLWRAEGVAKGPAPGESAPRECPHADRETIPGRPLARGEQILSRRAPRAGSRELGGGERRSPGHPRHKRIGEDDVAEDGQPADRADFGRSPGARHPHHAMGPDRVAEVDGIRHSG